MDKFSAVIKKSGRQHVALCLELGVVGSGSSAAAAKRSLLNAIESYLEYTKDEGIEQERPVSIKELHEFLYYEDAFKKPHQRREHRLSLKVLEYA
ncbi:MAG: type II toxin-antitoxin system HicB family antitoxin [Ignavibacteriae bacterium]|nr:type II toxin-antitoxin system HicB family antitoxin [Ignavibacteriota bacterium]